MHGHTLPDAVYRIATQPVPGDSGLPLLGHSLSLIWNLDRRLQRQHQRYGEVSWISAFGRRLTLLLGADSNQFVLQQQARQFSSRAWSLLLKPFFEPALLCMDAEEHRLHREALRDAFRHDALRDYLRLMAPRVDAALAGRDAQRAPRLLTQLKPLTLDLACHALIGVEARDDVAALSKAFLAARQALGHPLRLRLPCTRWQRGLDGRRQLDTYFRNCVGTRRQAGGADLLTRLCGARLADGRSLTDAEVADHLIFLLMAGHDTTSSLLAATVFLLGQHLGWQQSLRDECRHVDAADAEQLMALPLLDLVFKEALRLSSPVPLLLREALSDCHYRGHDLPAGTLVALSPAFTHRLPCYWENPDRFDPHRFGAARREDRAHPFAYLPFGAGVHKCIGMGFGESVAKLLLCKLLQGWRWTVPADRALPSAYAPQYPSWWRVSLSLQRLQVRSGAA